MSNKVKNFVKSLVEEMTELRRQNYHAQEKIDKRNQDIQEIEEALKTLKVPFKTDWKPEYDYENDDDE